MIIANISLPNHYFNPTESILKMEKINASESELVEQQCAKSFTDAKIDNNEMIQCLQATGNSCNKGESVVLTRVDRFQLVITPQLSIQNGERPGIEEDNAKQLIEQLATASQDDQSDAGSDRFTMHAQANRKPLEDTLRSVNSDLFNQKYLIAAASLKEC